jgi:16S rRNA (uracil1498-N3)-methyltransferase
MGRLAVRPGDPDNPRVAPRSGEPGSASARRFFLERRPTENRAALQAGEAQHALRVLRLQVGDRLTGLDGKGGSWPARVAAVGRNAVEVELEGEGRVDPPAGAPGSPLPWIEIEVAWPKQGRVEDMLDRLTQLGAAAIAPLSCERAGPYSGELTGARRERCERVLREACKQSGRTWLPVLRGEPSPNPADILLLDPGSNVGLSAWVAEIRARESDRRWTEERPLCVRIGPEGGFTPTERESWVARGALPLRLGPNVLRLETAAEAAMAILAAGFFTPPRS